MLQEVLSKIGSDIRYAEDKAIVFGVVFQNIKICFIDAICYHYCIRSNSVCHIENPDFLIELTAFYNMPGSCLNRTESMNICYGS